MSLKNPFKARLANGETLIGLWLALANAYTAELCASADFDWMVIDGEHAPNDIRTILSQLQALHGYDVHPVVRLPVGETWLIKQVLDIGAQTILVPMVESAEQARSLVQAVRYAPEGVRGVGAALARASAFGRQRSYLAEANEEVCLLIQIENQKGLSAIEEICRVDGVDGVFVGPSDLAADMGFRGRAGADEVQSAVVDAIERISAAGKTAGVLSTDRVLARRYQNAGAKFVAIGTDVGVLTAGLDLLRKEYGHG